MEPEQFCWYSASHYRLNYRGTLIPFPGVVRDLSPLHCAQTYPTPLPSAYPAGGTRVYLLEGKATEREAGIRLHLEPG
jgi:hypothetical protein